MVAATVIIILIIMTILAYLPPVLTNRFSEDRHEVSFILAQVGASLVAQMIKNPTSMQETWAQSLGRENPLKEDMATHSSILAWKIPWSKEPGGLQSIGSKESDMTEMI